MMAGSATFAAIPFAVSRGPRLLYQCIAVNMRFLLSIFKQGTENGFIRFADMHCTK
jgi:hypothetical protein